MSKPREKWWGYVKAIIRAYPEHCAELKALKQQSVTAAYDITPRAGGPGKPVEALAIKTLSPSDQREYEAVRAAIRETKRLRDGAEQLKLIDMVFWRQTHTLQGAAEVCHVSYRTARRWHGSFILTVARYFGLE